MDDESGKDINISPIVAPAVGQALEKTQVGKYHMPGGHGFAAEDANHFADQIRGKNPNLAGISNELNGADRVVGGVKIQSKYFRSASETVASAFDEMTGNYRYTGQVLEVPKDQYEECVKLMRKRIANGKVPGITDPAQAEAIVRQGTVTYPQARNIARAGTIESLKFDAKTQAVTSSGIFALSFAISYMQGKLQGSSNNEAVREALKTGLASGSASFVTGMVTSQVLRTKAAAFGAVSIRTGLKTVSGTTLGKEAIHRIAAGSAGKALYGAAAVNHVSKLLRTNAVTAAVTTVITATPDFYRAAFNRSISWNQFMKNLGVNVVGVAGGTAGWMGGAAAGAAIGSIFPGAGTAIGGIVGGILCAVGVGAGSTAAAKAIADMIMDDDAKLMVDILQDVIADLASEYLITEKEVAVVSGKIKETVTPDWLRDMFKARGSDKSKQTATHQSFVRNAFEPHFMAIVQDRPKIALPSPEVMAAEMEALISELEKVEEETGDAA